ncbi:DUF992 domain-containing protein [Sinorhizobium americanum]|uniref:Uncharacterized protein DUF992 n=1 Tax=Sinorhizobium americanum TaxID=194963 RepID=A0A4R2C152_9HYPH|nr:DUF992 domain-containing protein [Sinorhizobium americanum]APG88186.1 hypothetical protein SAMCCGM7_pC0990 [Sinorhizobium americanum CCGM7]TCN33263.1 uncharacterized protein DUF992 [Sinorhizobium americanum]
MHRNLVATLSAASLSLVGFAAHAADLSPYREPAPPPVLDEQDGVKIGYLECDISGGAGYVLGSSKEIECVFRSLGGDEIEDRYTGEIRKLGVDIGFTMRSRLLWAVFAPTAGYHHGSLSGLYKGATAEATVGAGVGANVLVGGTSGSIHLQTVSVTGQLGLNVAAAGTSMTLNSVN